MLTSGRHHCGSQIADACGIREQQQHLTCMCSFTITGPAAEVPDPP